MTLFAKSKKSGKTQVTLEAHLSDTGNAAVALFSVSSRWGANFPSFFGVAESEYARFRLHVEVASLLHDIGKANEDFQQALVSNIPQRIRHEHLSAFIVLLDEVQEWLSTNEELDIDVLVAAILSHHLKASDQGDRKWCEPKSSGEIDLYIENAELSKTLERIAKRAALTDPPKISLQIFEAVKQHPRRKKNKKRSHEFGRKIKKDAARLSLLMAVKAGVIVADSVASGLVREGHAIEKWIDDVAHSPALEAADIQKSILEPRLEQISKSIGKPALLHAFQELVAEVGPRVLLLASCGSGKTLAAWRWAQKQLENKEVGRVIFLYPTRGTATEGFRDYVSWAPESEASLLHGTSKYELDKMQENPTESMKDKQYVDEANARLFALALWSKRYFSATVDQFLSFLEHRYQSICLLPALADSVVIIDEVHSFDPHLFENLIVFLKKFNVPTLCMTATLSNQRRTQLEEVGLKPYPRHEDRKELADLEEKETTPRYKLLPLGTDADAMTLALDSFNAGQRILWVVNTIAECQRLANELEKKLGTTVLSYHSRFRLEDRNRIHQKTVAAFQQREAAVIAVTTQVCEMSLDLDADVLISHVAPPSALVQRFGRSNRHHKPGHPHRGVLLVIPPLKHAPYAKNEIEAGQNFIQELASSERDLSQRDLAEAMEKHSVKEDRPRGAAQFVDSGYYAEPGSLREENDYTRQALLLGDVNNAENLGMGKYDGLVLPIPKNKALPEDRKPSWMPRFLSLAPDDEYSPTRGFGGTA